MAEPFIGEVKMVGFNFAPVGWAPCDGRLLPIAQYDALFALLGTTYGGDGKSTFALPNLQGRAPMHLGQGPGLSLRNLGETGGNETVTLSESELPAHSHAMMAQSSLATNKTPTANTLARPGKGQTYAPASANVVAMASQTLAPAGGQAPHNNMMPYLTFYFCIALQGVFPPRS